MDIKNVVQASATIVTITKLSPGDVYKRLDENYSGARLIFGVVQSVLNNGAEAAISAIEYETEYSSEGVVAKSKVFNAAKEVAIFAATPDEISTHIDELIERAQRYLETKERDVAKARDAFTKVQTLKQLLPTLTPSYIEPLEVEASEIATEA